MEILINIQKILFDSKESINYLFAYAIIILAILDISISLINRLFFLITNYKFFNQEIDFKTQIVSLGVLGTFVGIFIGLQDFNLESIESSIPALLSGLKTAFVTSIFGMFVSIVLSIFKAPLLNIFTSLLKIVIFSFSFFREREPKVDLTKDRDEILIEYFERFNDRLSHFDIELIIYEFEKIRTNQYNNQRESRELLSEVVDLLRTQGEKEESNEVLSELKSLNQNLIDLKKLSIKEIDSLKKVDELISQNEKILERLKELKMNVYYGA